MKVQITSATFVDARTFKYLRCATFRLRHFAQTPFEISTLTFVGDEGEGARIAACGFSAKIEAAEKIGARRVEQMIILQLSAEGGCVELGESLARTVDHGDGDGAIERYDGRRLDAFELIVETQDPSPVRLLRAQNFAMLRGDGGLQGEWASAATQRFGYEREGLGDLLMIPKLTVLLFKNDDVAGVVEAGIAAGIVQEHEGDEASGLRGGERRGESAHEASETDGLAGEIGANQLAAACGRVSLVEDEIDCGQHGVEARGHFIRIGDRVGNSGVANFALGANEPLRHGCGGDEEGARDFVRLKAAEGAERERDLRVQRERGMAAGEDEAKTVVGDFDGVVVRNFSDGREAILHERLDLLVETLFASDAVDGFVAGGLDDPGAGEIGHAGFAPLHERGGKGFLCRLFGEIEVADEPDEDGDDSAPLGTIDCFDGRCGVQRHTRL